MGDVDTCSAETLAGARRKAERIHVGDRCVGGNAREREEWIVSMATRHQDERAAGRSETDVEERTLEGWDADAQRLAKVARPTQSRFVDERN
mmetsp:Transcript_2775/g.17275  ORF Transcript_2775/g.17275 Transcript_2775/m.17275 type:complete len:92 (+) Transcript_2775:186-461(+)